MSAVSVAADRLFQLRQAARRKENPELDELVSALEQCRDLVPIPPPGHPLENSWMAAMADPAAVPFLLKEYMESQEHPLQMPVSNDQRPRG